MEALTTGECKGYLQGPPRLVVDIIGSGHKDTIVAVVVALTPRKGETDGHNRLTTWGRDGKVLLWELDLVKGKGKVWEVALE